MSDRKLGYILMFITFALLAGSVSYFAWYAYAPREKRVLRFPEVGSLAIEDAVRMNGTLVGVVSGFEYDSSGHVLVHVETPLNRYLPFAKDKEQFPESIPIRTSSEATVKVKGLMGERYIEITLGDLNDPLVPKDQIVDGKFEMGPSEAVAYMDLLNDKIVELRDIMLWLRDGKDDGKRPFTVAFNDIIGTVDTLVWKLMTGLDDVEGQLANGLAAAADITDQAIRFTADVSAKAPEIMESVNSMMKTVDGVIVKVDSIFTKLDKLSEEIDSNKYLWGDHAEKLQKQIAEVKKAIESIRLDGMDLKVRVKLW